MRNPVKKGLIIVEIDPLKMRFCDQICSTDSLQTDKCLQLQSTAAAGNRPTKDMTKMMNICKLPEENLNCILHEQFYFFL